MEIHPGDIFWLTLPEPGSIPHPHVIVAVEAGSRLVTVCALTTNRKRVSLPGNLLLDAGEANLPRASVVEVSKVFTVDAAQLGEPIGSLAPPRLEQIRAGIRFVQRLTSRNES